MAKQLVFVFLFLSLLELGEEYRENLRGINHMVRPPDPEPGVPGLTWIMASKQLGHGCGSKLNDRRGKPRVLAHVSTYQGNPFWYFPFF